MAVGNLLTTAEVAALLGVSTMRVSQFVAEERLLPRQRVGTAMLFEKKDVAAFAKKPRKRGRPAKKQKKSRRSIDKD